MMGTLFWQLLRHCWMEDALLRRWWRLYHSTQPKALAVCSVPFRLRDPDRSILWRGRKSVSHSLPVLGSRAEGADERLAAASVVVVGSTPWSRALARELVSAEIARVHVIGTGNPPARGLADDVVHTGATRVTTAHCETIAERLQLPTGDWDLLVAACAADELRMLYACARTGHHLSLPSVSGYLDGLHAVIGPAVVPNKSVCWNCFRLRQLANQKSPEIEHALQERLLRVPLEPRDAVAPNSMGELVGQLLALEVIKLITGYATCRLIDSMLAIDLVTLGSELHSVIRMPWCDVCGGAAGSGQSMRVGAAGRGVRTSGSRRPGHDSSSAVPATSALESILDSSQLRAALAGWVDKRTGLIRHLELLDFEPGHGNPVFVATAVSGGYTHGHQPPAISRLSCGRGLTAVDAMIGAVGEALERYSAARHDPSRIHRACIAELDGEGFDPRWLGLYTDPQYDQPSFPFARFDPEQPLDWIGGRWLDTGSPVWVPAFAAYLDYPTEPGKPLCQVTSSGLAAGRDVDDAVLRATLELIERDAFMLTWHGKVPARRIDLSGADSQVGDVVRHLRLQGVVLELYWLSAAHDIPVVLCIALGDARNRPAAAASLGCHLDGARAVHSAVLEQVQLGAFVETRMSGQVPREPTDVRAQEEHALYYRPKGRLDALDFLRSHPQETVAMDELPRVDEPSLVLLRERLASAGMRVAIVNVTAPDVALGPFSVARAVGVDFAQIEFGFAFRRMANPRLQHLVDDKPLNPHPHPMA